MNEIAVIEEKVLTTPEKAKALEITDSDSFTAAGEMLLGIKDLRKEIDAAFDPIISKAHAAHKEAVAQKKKAEGPLAEAEDILKPKIASYQEEQERIRRAEELRLQEEMRKQEEEQRLNEIKQEIKGGNIERAEEIFQEPIAPNPVILPKSVPKVDGLSTRKVWNFRIDEQRHINRQYLTPDLVAIRAQVKALGKDAEKLVGGITVWQESVVAAGRR